MSRLNLATRETAAPAIALVTSLSTLVCCTLPAVMITFGMGAALSSLTANIPQLIWLSAHKPLVFGGSLVLLFAAWGVRYLTRNMPCPADPAQAKLCSNLRRFGGWILYIGFGVWVIGAFSAFILPKLLS
tara:strand:- start:78 stop:467 length:390 start_codon:yes stop_codon:yes gene_type:complete